MTREERKSLIMMETRSMEDTSFAFGISVPDLEALWKKQWPDRPHCEAACAKEYSDQIKAARGVFNEGR